MYAPLALIDAPIMIGIVAIGILLFGADKLPKLARSAGLAKKEFILGHADADATARNIRQPESGASTEQPASSSVLTENAERS